MTTDELARLYDQHAAALFRFLMALTRGSADTRDLLQDVFVRAAKRPADEVWRDSEAWLFRTARNLVIDQVRRLEVRARTLDAYSRELPPDGPNDESALAAVAAAALSGLPDDQRAVVHLKLWEGLTFARIGDVLGIPPDTAASRYRYALTKLRRVLPQPNAFHEPA